MSENIKVVASKPYAEGAGFILPEMGILSHEVTGIEQLIQAFQVDVRESAQEIVHHLVVNAHYPELERDLCENLELFICKHFGEVIVSFTVSDEPGNAVFYLPSKQRGQCSFLSIASAIAVIKRSCGWDDSERIRVICETTGEAIELKNPVYEEGQFEIEVSNP